MNTNQPFVIERTYNAPAEKVWKAITDKTQMKQWYFDLEKFEPKVGFEFSFEGGPQDKKYLHHYFRHTNNIAFGHLASLG